jgi:hypothetical protein
MTAAHAGAHLRRATGLPGRRAGGSHRTTTRGESASTGSGRGATPELGKILAHELGHLPSLPDLGAGENYNLMSMALRADDRLTSHPIRQARGSDLVRRVYRSHSP